MSFLKRLRSALAANRFRDWVKAKRSEPSLEFTAMQLKQSGLFDAPYYSRTYLSAASDSSSNAVNGGVDPILHYLQQGAKEGKNPNPFFDTAYYLAANPDVARSGMNPLVHYVNFGRKEGRLTLPPRCTGSYSGYARVSAQNRTANRSRFRAGIGNFAVKPFFSIVLPVYNTPLDVLQKALASVRNQIYENWEICIVDDRSPHSEIADYLRDIAGTERRIQVRFQAANGGISAATNAGIAMSRGDFVALLDHDDELTEDALYRFACAINDNRDADILYSDQDIVDKEGVPFAHMFKPAWSPEFFRGVMYLGHLVAVRRTLLEKTDGCNSRFDGVQDFELELRLTELTEKIVHIPHVLYHWRALPGTTASSGSEKQAKLQQAAVQEHLDRLEIPALAQRIGATQRIRLAPKARTTHPLVSILAAPRATPDVVRRQIERLAAQTDYPNVELLLPSNALGGEALHGVRCSVRKAAAPAGPRWTAMNALAAAAHGEFLIFFELGAVPAQADWIQHLLMYAERPRIGIVGPRLENEFGSVASAGVTFEASGEPLDLHRGSPPGGDGYMGNLACSHETLAVRAECALLRAALFKQHGGFVADYQQACADFDLCLRLHASGLRNMYAASVSVQIGFNSTSESGGADLKRFAERWADALKSGDPYCNPNAYLSFDAPLRQGLLSPARQI